MNISCFHSTPNISIFFVISSRRISEKKNAVRKTEKQIKYINYFLLPSIATSNDKSARNAPSQTQSSNSTTATANSSNDNSNITSFEEVPSDDLRRFHIPDNKWKLQPTIKLLTAYGNEVEPFGADYILQKLGFRHARLTIPKWLQRGIMDPCEQSMSVVQLFLLFLLPERFKEMCMRQ